MSESARVPAIETDGVSDAYELSVVMPCLNEADTLATCIDKALQAIREHGISAEVIVADNGSTDGSVQIALAHGARVVHVDAKGYGNALMGGILAARGRFVIMGDADDSYDFLEIPRFVEQLRAGHDLVQGCRLPRGGGTIMPGAMPPSHRLLGNPMFTLLVRNWFGAPINDVYCGLRGFTRKMWLELDQRCTGMEFATEMIIKSSLYGYRISEVPITLHPDGRKAHKPHLRTIRDGWRTLRFFMLYSPRWLYLVPGTLLGFFGLFMYLMVYGGVHVGPATLGAHSLLVGSLSILMGYQAILFGTLTKAFAIGEGLMPLDRKMRGLFHLVNLERGLVAGALAFAIGIGLIGTTVFRWAQADFGPLNYEATMRWVVPGITLSALGFQTVLGSFFLSVLGLRRT
jgi:glycosyltransferase involved in cell wall biosynthesis